MSELFDVVVAGGGPAGMMAAIAAAQAGASVALCEHMDKLGLKLLASGGGRCNLTNTDDEETFLRALGRQGRFAQPALAALSSEALRQFFEGLGVATVCPDERRVYPAANSAAVVQKALIQKLKDSGVRVLLGAEIESLLIENGSAVGLVTSKGAIRARAVVLALGGLSYPELGAGESGIRLARQAGHSIVKPLPALVGLMTSEDWPRLCAGVSIPATVAIALKGQPKAGVAGDLLFTHRGVSGPVILDLSGLVAELLEKHKSVPLAVNLVPGRGKAAWLEQFDAWQNAHGTRMVRLLLNEHLPASLSGMLCRLANLGDRLTAAHMDRDQRHTLAGLLAELPLTVTATEGFRSAIVTRGGVALKEVDPRTLQSKLVPGLYFAGELLDLDGPCGGYNLQWAFSSGRLAGNYAADNRNRQANNSER